MDEHNRSGPDAADDHVNHTAPAAPTVSTRRTFLGDIGKKAMYITPVLLTLTASPAMASPADSCARTGSPCLLDSECCGALTCNLGTNKCN